MQRKRRRKTKPTLFPPPQFYAIIPKDTTFSKEGNTLRQLKQLSRAKQMSESVRLGIILALAGGFMDAYSYIERGGVFANAQTGNIILMGINIAEKKWIPAFHYLIPILAFTVGIICADFTQYKMTEKKQLHWRQISVLLEAIALLFVYFMPQSMNLFANSLISFACGIQVESFRKIHGNGIATTMCTGNLRSATEKIVQYWHTKNANQLRTGLLYYGIIVWFIIGAILGNVSIKLLEEQAILVCAILFLIAFIMMFIDKEGSRT